MTTGHGFCGLRVFCGGYRRLAPQNFLAIRARNDEHSVADIDGHLVPFFGQDFADHGGVILQLNSIGRYGPGADAKCERGECDNLSQHAVKVTDPPRFDKQVGSWLVP